MNINKFRNIVAVLLMLVLGGNAFASSMYFIQTDQLNTPRAVTDQSNALLWKWDSDPYGSVPPNEQPAGGASFVFNLRFPGQVFDRETYIYYNYFRDYDPQIGRYVQSDPIGLKGGINTYAYVGGNPLSATDTTGNCPWCFGAVVGGLIGGGTNVIQQLNGDGPINWKVVAINTAGGAVSGASGAWIGAVTTSIAKSALAGAIVNGAVGMATQTATNASGCDPLYKGQAANFVRNAALGALGGAAGQALANLGTTAQAAINRANLLSLGKGLGYSAANSTLGRDANALGTAVGNGVSNLGGFSDYPSGVDWK